VFAADEIRAIFKRGQERNQGGGRGEGATSAVASPGLAGESPSWRADSFYRAPYNSRMSPARKLPKWLKSLGRVSGRR